jgi:hypothetical protein
MNYPYPILLSFFDFYAYPLPDNFLKVPLRGTFKKLSGFYDSAERCNASINRWFSFSNRTATRK